VRDELAGLPVHDIDLVTEGDGLQLARQLANAFHGAYYPVDQARRVGRAIVHIGNERVSIDAASFRGQTLSEDLAGRDFTINAMAVRLDQLDRLFDPLDGQGDLFDRHILRQCSKTSIANDPIRALRAVRHALQFNLRLDRAARSAARSAASGLSDADGHLIQPERARDELFNLLGGSRPATGVRVLNTLGLLRPLYPFPPERLSSLEAQLNVMEHLHHLLELISPARDDNTAADLIMGVAVMVLDRHRRQLQEHLAQQFGDGRSLPALLLLSPLTPPGSGDGGQHWADHLRLSGSERRTLDELERSVSFFPMARPAPRTIHRYFRQCGETGIGGVLLYLARELAAQPLASLSPVRWGALLEDTASPLFESFFRRHQQIISPPPLLDGRELQMRLGLQPGPSIGVLLERLLEAQAAGEIHTKEEALQLAERLAATLS
jgi:poly(A) polymerase/tRNA nucleotidyltransferase (CCA-adding enzyme)